MPNDRVFDVFFPRNCQIKSAVNCQLRSVQSLVQLGLNWYSVKVVHPEIFTPSLTNSWLLIIEPIIIVILYTSINVYYCSKLLTRPLFHFTIVENKLQTKSILWHYKLYAKQWLFQQDKRKRSEDEEEVVKKKKDKVRSKSGKDSKRNKHKDKDQKDESWRMKYFIYDNILVNHDFYHVSIWFKSHRTFINPSLV